MRKWIKNWLFKEENKSSEVAPAYDMLRHHPAIQAYKITNGYIVCTRGASNYLTETMPALTYCKDHQEIADYIVKRSAVDKLVGQQMELPLTGGYVGSGAARMKAYPSF